MPIKKSPRVPLYLGQQGAHRPTLGSIALDICKKGKWFRWLDEGTVAYHSSLIFYGLPPPSPHPRQWFNEANSGHNSPTQAKIIYIREGMCVCVCVWVGLKGTIGTNSSKKKP